jgi:hypothetical protein
MTQIAQLNGYSFRETWSEEFTEVQVNQRQRTDIWESLLDAEMREAFWSSEAQRYSSQDRALTIWTAVLSSATVVALFTSYPPSGKLLAIAASVLSIVHATIFNRTRVKQISSLATAYKELAIELKLLWSEVQSGKADDTRLWKEYEGLVRREKKIDESPFKINEKRKKAAQQEVFRARGLKHVSRGTPVPTTSAKANTTAAPNP